jgi:type II secretion system protein G
MHRPVHVLKADLARTAGVEIEANFYVHPLTSSRQTLCEPLLASIFSPDYRPMDSSRGNRLTRGFTLIEIMVVVVIMGILAALVVPKLMGRTDDARIMAARQDIATLMQSIKLYKLDNGRYPTTEQGLQALVTKPTGGPAAPGWKAGDYFARLPKDPGVILTNACHRDCMRKLTFFRLAQMATQGALGMTPTLVLGNCNASSARSAG